VRFLIGIGNYCGLDDSVGLRVAETIGERGLDAAFQAIDMGGNLLDLVHYLGAGAEQVLVVDAARMGLSPGDFAFFSPHDVVTRKPLQRVSAHEGDLMRVLEFAAALGEPVAPVTILGIEPAEIRSEPGLSAVVAERLDEYVEAAVSFLTPHTP
jgi:hydrogenase maturation protease